MGQTSYSLDAQIAVSGQIAEPMNPANYVVHYVAAEDLPAGRMLELDSTGKKCQTMQGTGGLGKALGVSVYKATNPDKNLPGVSASVQYKAGEMVAVLRRGRIFADFTGTTDAAMTQPNVSHSSTTATDRGKFTDAATSTTAGSEVAALPGAEFVKPINATQAGLCLVELNLPAGQ